MVKFLFLVPKIDTKMAKLLPADPRYAHKLPLIGLDRYGLVWEDDNGAKYSPSKRLRAQCIRGRSFFKLPLQRRFNPVIRTQRETSLSQLSVISRHFGTALVGIP